MNTNNQEAPLEGDIEELLPWHAAGTLNRRDAQRVEDALKRDPELARRYALVREELSETIHLNETLGAPSARAMEKLFTQIDAEPKRRQASSLNLGTRISEFFGNLSPRTLAWSASAAAIAILLQAGFLANIVLKEHTAGGFETASVGGSVTSKEVGSYVLLRFNPQASAVDINMFLERNKLKIADGPAPGGLYRVRVGANALPQDELTRTVKQLQQDKTVAFIAVTD